MRVPAEMVDPTFLTFLDRDDDGKAYAMRAALRRKVCLAAKKAHGFPLRGVYVFKFPAAELWQKLDVRALARSALGQLRLDKRVRHFIIRRTSIVQTRGRKLTDLFCNFRDIAALPTSPPCMCHTASPFLPRNSEGHVCARTTDLNDPTLSHILSRSLKDTPTYAVNYHTAAADAGLSYLSQFAAFSSRNEDEDLDRFLPLGFDEKGTTYRAERNTVRSVQKKRVNGRVTAVECWTKWFVVKCAGRLVMRIFWTRLKWLLMRLAAVNVEDAQPDSVVVGHIIYTAKRMVFWVTHITRDYWINPYPDQNAIRFVFSLRAELFGTPFDVNENCTLFFTPYTEDTIFGAGLDAHSFWWRLMALGNPLYTRRRIRQAIEHALDSARGTKQPVRILLTVPAWEDYTLTPFVHRMMQLKKHAYKFLAPQSALGYEDRSTGARFNVDVLLIQNVAAKRRYPVTAGGIARLRAHFRGRLKIEPTYSGDWVAPYCAGRASLNAERWDVEVIPGSLTRAMKRLLTTADVHVRLCRMTNRWLMEQRVPAGRHVHCVGGAADADTYQEALRNFCAGTVRFPFDRNPTVGGLMCQQQYHRLVVQERETSAAQFEKVTTGDDCIMEELKNEYQRLMMHTVATFDNHGSFGNLYVMVKDKSPTNDRGPDYSG
ncbi:hypothetical protein CYMTET_49464 [Cymbomonas tetramitiformis]|uniref:Uncharacterized protein n=1 Tax=Cymbomonas tetramitiformis TaxID=36881 RepID=A0AAE0BRT8_9CHLO|nr:hypothetical protein CYMTET_49464 [Cymbomonas tetramitiformis]